MSTYIYGFMHASHPLRIEGMKGVGAQASTLRVLHADDLAAVVSDAPGDLRPRRRDLETHHRILEALAAEDTVLPMSFGVVASDDSAIRAELESAADHYRGLLTRLARKVEINVKASHQQEAILCALLLEHRTLRERNDALRVRDGGNYSERVQFGEQLASALEDRRAEDAERVLTALKPHACQTRLGPEGSGFLNASFLVTTAGRRALEAAFEDVQQELAGIAEVRVFGPLPPYSFVEVPRVSSESLPWVC